MFDMPPDKRLDVNAQLEMVSRQRIEKARSDYELWKDRILSTFVMGLVTVVTVVCLIILLSNRYPIDMVVWARTMLTTIVFFAIGYRVGKSTRKR